MNKKLLDIFVDPKILFKEAIEKDLKEIEKFLRKKIRVVHQDWHLDRKELKCVREIKKHLIQLNSSDIYAVIKRTKDQKYKYYSFCIDSSIDVDDIKELLKIFASNTISVFINQKTQVECTDDHNWGSIVECPNLGLLLFRSVLVQSV